MLFAICAVVGIVFGVAFMSGQNASALLEMQTEDAQKLQEAVKPKVDEFQTVVEKISKMNSNTPDATLANELAEYDFVVPGAILASVRIPLPAGATDTVSQFAADTQHLKTLIDDHKRLTTKVDAEEIQAILENNKALQDNRAFAVMYDVDDVRKNSEGEKYQPKPGRLVGVKDYNQEKNVYEIEFLGAGRTGEVTPEKIVPIETSQILKTGGQNAMQRYSWRVRNLKYYANKINGYVDSMQNSLATAASGDMEAVPPAPAVAAPAEEPAAEPPAAEEPAEEEGGE